MLDEVVSRAEAEGHRPGSNRSAGGSAAPSRRGGAKTSHGRRGAGAGRGRARPAAPRPHVGAPHGGERGRQRLLGRRALSSVDVSAAVNADHLKRRGAAGGACREGRGAEEEVMWRRQGQAQWRQQLPPGTAWGEGRLSADEDGGRDGTSAGGDRGGAARGSREGRGGARSRRRSSDVIWMPLETTSVREEMPPSLWCSQRWSP